jgi:hypothetical protein
MMAIIGAHVLLFTPKADELRATLRDVFGWRYADAGEGWLIFGLPPAELGVHPAEGPTYESGVRHQFSLMCDDIQSTIQDLRAKGIGVTSEPQDEGWGITTMLNLPGDVEVMLYEPRHPVAIASPKTSAAGGAGGAAKKAAVTRKRRAAGAKAARTRKRRAAGKKAATRRAAASVRRGRRR